MQNADSKQQRRRKPLTDEQKERNREAVCRYREKNRELITERRKASREKANERNRAYYAANRDLVLEKSRKNYIANRDVILQKMKAFREASPELIVERQRLYRQRNLDSARASERRSKKRWRESNPHLVAELSARNRAHRTRKLWGDKALIEEAYDLAKRRTEATGVQWEVDHIVPLNSGIVCGLHVEDNLRVIPMAMNRSKSNKSWPGHPKASLSIGFNNSIF